MVNYGKFSNGKTKRANAMLNNKSFSRLQTDWDKEISIFLKWIKFSLNFPSHTHTYTHKPTEEIRSMIFFWDRKVSILVNKFINFNFCLLRSNKIAINNKQPTLQNHTGELKRINDSKIRKHLFIYETFFISHSNRPISHQRKIM